MSGVRRLPNKLGWMEPVYWGHQQDGRPLAALSPEQFEKVRQGYACPRCWQEFQMVFVKCPVCQLDLSPNLDPQVAEFPDEWKPGPDNDMKIESRKGG